MTVTNTSSCFFRLEKHYSIHCLIPSLPGPCELQRAVCPRSSSKQAAKHFGEDDLPWNSTAVGCTLIGQSDVSISLGVKGEAGVGSRVFPVQQYWGMKVLSFCPTNSPRVASRLLPRSPFLCVQHALVKTIFLTLSAGRSFKDKCKALSEVRTLPFQDGETHKAGVPTEEICGGARNAEL